MVEIAEREGADAVGHGATGKGNDQVRFELTVKALNPKLKIIAPWREWHIRSREDALELLCRAQRPGHGHHKSIYSRDRNLWHLSHEGGILEDPWQEPEEEMYQLQRQPGSGARSGRVRRDRLRAGHARARQRRGHGPGRADRNAQQDRRRHGVGRVDLVENRLVGMKSRGVYETPGGTILYAAHQELEQVCLDRTRLHYKEMIALRYAELVYNGQWFTPLREALDAFVNMTQRNVTGTVRLKLYKGNVMLVGRKSPHSLYREDFATFGEDDVYNQADADGFINLFGLPMKVSAMLDIEGSGRSKYRQPDYSAFKRD